MIASEVLSTEHRNWSHGRVTTAGAPKALAAEGPEALAAVTPCLYRRSSKRQHPHNQLPEIQNRHRLQNSQLPGLHTPQLPRLQKLQSVDSWASPISVLTASEAIAEG